MKILILATPRSGSSALQTAVSEAHNLEWFSEPFNQELQDNWDGNKPKEHLYPYKSNPFEIPDGFVIKSLTFFNHWADAFSHHWADGMDAYLKAYGTDEYQEQKQQFYLDYIDHFDNVILLLRRDVGDQLRSMLIGMQQEAEAGHRLYDHWNNNYKAFNPVLDDIGVLHTQLLFDSIKIIENISTIRKLPIVYYEDLYNIKPIFDHTNTKFDLGLEGMWPKHFDPEKRWRR